MIGTPSKVRGKKEGAGVAMQGAPASGEEVAKQPRGFRIDGKNI